MGPNVNMKPGVRLTLKKLDKEEDFGSGELSLDEDDITKRKSKLLSRDCFGTRTSA